MPDKTLTTLYYEQGDADFLRKSFGFTDPNHDGKLTAKELKDPVNDNFRDFYATILGANEKAILAGFTATHPLSKSIFSVDPLLTQIALKHLRYAQTHAIINAYGLAAQPDAARLVFDLKKQSESVFNTVTIDLKEIHDDLKTSDWNTLISGDLSRFPTNTLKILRSFIGKHAGDISFAITYANWESEYAGVVGCPVTGNVDSVESTWNEVLLLWQKSDAECHWLINLADWTYGKINGGLMRIGEPDHKIQARGVASYLKKPGEFVFPNEPKPSGLAPSPLRGGRVLTTSTWPNTKSHITLLNMMGVSIGIDANPNATITAYQDVHGGALGFQTGRPLLSFNGFAFNVDASHPITKTIDKRADAFLALFGKTFDVEDLNILGITVFKNRICLILSGENNSQDVIKPIGDDDLFFDIGFYIKGQLDKLDPTKKLSQTIFDASGNVYSHIAVTDLTDAILKALCSGSTPKPAAALPPGVPPFTQWEQTLRAEDVRADFSAPIKQLESQADVLVDPSVTNLQLTNGRFEGHGQWPNAFLLQGTADLTLALKSTSIKVGQNNVITLKAETIYDTAQGAGFVRLTLPPDTKVSGLGSMWDGIYDGEILIGFTLPTASLQDANGSFAFDAFVNQLGLKILADLKTADDPHNHRDFLAAALDLGNVTMDVNTGKLATLTANYDLSFVGRDESLFGVIQDGTLSILKPPPDDIYESTLYQITASQAVIGGFTRLFGEDVVLEITTDAAGVYHIRPAAKRVEWNDGNVVRTSDISGEITLTPPAPDDKDPYFQIQFTSLAVSIADAEIFTGATSIRGKTRALLSGTWQIPARTLTDVLRFDGNWDGHGKLRLTNTGNVLKVTDADTKTAVDFDAKRLGSVFTISSMRFSPYQVSGSAQSQIVNGNVTVATPLITGHTDVAGKINAQGIYPLVRFVVDNPDATKSDDVPPELKLPPLDPDAISPDFKETDFLNELLAPIIQHMLQTPSSQTGLAYFISQDFDYEPFGDSINNADFSMGRLPLALDAEYVPTKGHKKRNIIRYPLFSGLLTCLNPQIEQGSVLSTASRQSLTKDKTLTEFRIDLNKPIRFLGFRINGIGIGHGNTVLSKKSASHLHLYIYTEHTRLDLMTLITLRYPCKVIQLYKGLHKQGIAVPCGEIPSNMRDLARFIKEMIGIFAIDDALLAEEIHQNKPLTVDEFQNLGPRQLKAVAKALAGLGLAQPVPPNATATQLLKHINTAAKNPNLVDSFKDHIDLFHYLYTSSAEDAIDEIMLTKFNREGQPLTTEDSAKILAGNYRLMHLYLEPFLTRPDYLDFNHSQDLSIAVDATLKTADYGIITVEKDATSPVALKLDYNPTDTPEHIANPGAYFVAGGDNAGALENIGFKYKIPSLWMQADFLKIGCLEYYLGRVTASHSSNYHIHLSHFVADNMELTYMPPSAFNKPSFTLFRGPDAAPATGPFNHFVGSQLELQRMNEDVITQFKIDDAFADNTYFYLYLGNGLDIHDMLVDASQAHFWNVETLVKHSYDQATRSYEASFGKVTGFMNIDNLPNKKPRALIYLGTTETGARRYLILSKLEAKGRFDVTDDNLLAQAHIGFVATLPDYIYSAPITQELRDHGVDFKIQTIEIDGTMNLILNGNYGGIKKSEATPEELGAASLGPGHLNDITVKLHGSFRFRVDNSWVTLTELTVPVDDVLLKILTQKNNLNVAISSVLLDTLKIPANRALTSGIDAHINTASRSSGGDVNIRDGQLSLSMKSPFEYHTDSKNAPGFATDGVNLDVADSDSHVDLNTGRITYRDNKGQVHNWQLDGEVQDTISKALIEVMLNGRLLEFGVPVSGDQPK